MVSIARAIERGDNPGKGLWALPGGFLKDDISLRDNMIKELREETKLKIETPIIHLSKHDIIAKGIELNAPLHLTWSCYQNEDEACGECDSCALRLRGFQTAGVEDPIPYKTRPTY